MIELALVASSLSKPVTDE
ncbi:hypothetical protein F383_07614 [Gossypium arboreum]|uniref:Uncharacterized protein n=1 Tax=Gossypium arboreum TaxID=29729 RepID=A0A0B0NBM7_GOSAR|nr:hypothetical protein F383_07614 [Gossypium arboreum]